MKRRSFLQALGLAAAAPIGLAKAIEHKPTFAEREAAIRAEDMHTVMTRQEFADMCDEQQYLFHAEPFLATAGTIRSRDKKLVVDLTNKRITLG